jgi:hypothetical protein
MLLADLRPIPLPVRLVVGQRLRVVCIMYVSQLCILNTNELCRHLLKGQTVEHMCLRYNTWIIRLGRSR